MLLILNPSEIEKAIKRYIKEEYPSAVIAGVGEVGAHHHEHLELAEIAVLLETDEE